MITDEQLAALDAAERAATKAPWAHKCIRESPQTKEFALRFLAIGKKRWRTEIPYTLSEHDIDFNDANLIALARNCMRQLLDEVLKYRAPEYQYAVPGPIPKSAILCRNKQIEELQIENAKLQARNAFLEDVFKNQALAIEKSINTEMKNAKLSKEVETLRAELADLRAAKPHSLSEGKRMVSQYQALVEKLRALLTEAHAALVNADEVAPCDNAAALIERIDDTLGYGKA